MQTLLRAVVLSGVLLCAAAPASAREVVRVERGALLFEDVAEPSPARAAAQSPYGNIRSAKFAGWLPDGGIAILTRFGETEQIHAVGAPGADRRQLTFHPEPIAAVAIAPAGAARLVYAKDTGGDEMFQLFLMDLPGGRTRAITEGRARNTLPLWRHDGGQLAYASTARNGRDADVWLWDEAGGARGVTTREGSWAPVDFAPDGSRLLVVRTVSINEVELHELTLADGSLRKVADVGGVGTYNNAYPALYVDDGRAVLYASSRGGEFATLWRLPLGGGKAKPWGVQRPWDVEELARSPDGRRIAALYNEDGSSVIRLMEHPSGRLLGEHEAGLGVFASLAFSRDGAQLGYSVSSPQMPGDAFSIDIAGDLVLRWTASESGGLDPEGWVAAQPVRYRSFDRVDGKPREVPALVYRPQGDGPHPVVIDIHGGPEAQERPGFDAWAQFLAKELGVAVVLPNVRGSAGYGRRWLDADNGLKRLDSVRDIGALLDWIDADPRLDPRRVVVYGGSYGGYMVLASLVEHGDRLAGGVSIVGISHFRTFLENTSPYRVDLRRVEYGDERDPKLRAFMDRTAPLANAAKIRAPLFVIHGANDPRVPASEAEQILAAVRANDREAWYLLARDEGHGFRKKANRDAMQRAVLAFYERFLVR